MSLYNMMHGVNPLAGIILTLLGTTHADVPRIRDSYVDEDGNLVIYTRTGGGNRSHYDSKESAQSEGFYDPEDPESYQGPFNEDLRQLKGFIRDEDDSFDCTYARFYYSAPEGYEDIFKDIGKSIGEASDPMTKFNNTMAQMEAPGFKASDPLPEDEAARRKDLLQSAMMRLAEKLVEDGFVEKDPPAEGQVVEAEASESR